MSHAVVAPDVLDFILHVHVTCNGVVGDMKSRSSSATTSWYLDQWISGYWRYIDLFIIYLLLLWGVNIACPFISQKSEWDANTDDVSVLEQI